MKDDRVLQSLLDALADRESVVDETLVRSVLEVAEAHQFDPERSMVAEKLLGLVSDFVAQQIGDEEE